ncbi:hypothetical protein [Xenorhabdus bovienii]|uniref:hypothetical protein n=1 Tax=Xenorhabdus bovienii TaxID=40576 RepID=UPI0023B23659|nr:hypothetical protein [Xenorhabdus bovienii]
MKSSPRKALLACPFNISQPDSIYINLLMWVQLRAAVEGGMFFRQPDGFADIADRLRQAQDKINRFMSDSRI